MNDNILPIEACACLFGVLIAALQSITNLTCLYILHATTFDVQNIYHLNISYIMNIRCLIFIKTLGKLPCTVKLSMHCKMHFHAFAKLFSPSYRTWRYRHSQFSVLSLLFFYLSVLGNTFLAIRVFQISSFTFPLSLNSVPNQFLFSIPHPDSRFFILGVCLPFLYVKSSI